MASDADPRHVAWRKSSRSSGNGACVEVANTQQAIMFRDSKDPQGPTLAVPRRTWTSLRERIARGSLDL